MRRLIPVGILVLLVVLGAACSSSAKKAEPAAASTTTTSTPPCTVTTQKSLKRIDVKVGGKARYALVHLPAKWDGRTAVPVVLSFHGLGSNAEQQRSTDGFVAHSDREGFIVVYPNAGGNLGALGAAWDLSGLSELPYVKAVLDDLEAKACVDTRRVYATGLSYGGGMTDLLACNMADRIAAAAPVSAYLPKRVCKPARPVPILSFHGVEDHLLPYKGGGVSRQQDFETWGNDWATRDGCTPTPTEHQYKPTVEALTYNGCKENVVLYRVHKNGHTWPGHPLKLDRDTMVDYFSGKTTGKPFPLMVVLKLTPEEFADTITLANSDIDASEMILQFFEQHSLSTAP
jgi:polyhydroxybutyrate depolymerase